MSKRKVAAPPPQRRPAHAPHQRRHLPGQQVAAHALEQADALLLVLGVDHRVGQVLQTTMGGAIEGSELTKLSCRIRICRAAAVAADGGRRLRQGAAGREGSGGTTLKVTEYPDDRNARDKPLLCPLCC